MATSVEFNSIPSNLRVPLFYAEVNSGQSPYQGPSRTLLIVQMSAAGTATANVPVILSGDPQPQMGAGSMLSEMAIWARQNNPFGEIWMLPLADPPGTRQSWTLTVAPGIVGQAGIISVYIGGYLIQVGVQTTDTQASVAANLVAAMRKAIMISAGSWPFR